MTVPHAAEEDRERERAALPTSTLVETLRKPSAENCRRFIRQSYVVGEVGARIGTTSLDRGMPAAGSGDDDATVLQGLWRSAARGICECDALVASYERLTALYHDLLGQESLAALLARAAEAVAELVPCSSLLIAEADVEQQVIVPLVVRGAWQEETLQMRPRFGEGLIGWAAANGRPVLANEAHLDARAGQVAGTPDDEPEAVMCFPLISGGVVVGAFSLYREGEGQSFSLDEFESLSASRTR